MCVHIYTCAFISICIDMPACIHICIHIYIYISIYVSRYQGVHPFLIHEVHGFWTFRSPSTRKVWKSCFLAMLRCLGRCAIQGAKGHEQRRTGLSRIRFGGRLGLTEKLKRCPQSPGSNSDTTSWPVIHQHYI